MEERATVAHSGNSNVIVHVETTSIAFALVCVLLATERINENEFNHIIAKLDELLDRHQIKDHTLAYEEDHEQPEKKEEKESQKDETIYAAPIKRLKSSRVNRYLGK